MHPIFGMPAAVATVDKYQGQQNDYVLLSLVRTRHIGTSVRSLGLGVTFEGERGTCHES